MWATRRFILSAAYFRHLFVLRSHNYFTLFLSLFATPLLFPLSFALILRQTNCEPSGWHHMSCRPEKREKLISDAAANHPWRGDPFWCRRIGVLRMLLTTFPDDRSVFLSSIWEITFTTFLNLDRQLTDAKNTKTHTGTKIKMILSHFVANLKHLIIFLDTATYF